jgi:peroxiredoxin
MKILKCLALFFWLTARAAEGPGGEMAGIGVVLGVEGQYLVVKSVLPDSPAAAQKNLQAGDRIVAVAQDKEPAVQVQGAKLAEVIPLIRGPKGTTVRLTIIPLGEEESRVRVVSFVRGELKELSRWGNGVLLTNGMKAPDIEMTGLENGRAERLLDYAGKIVVLEFWATWCGPCQKAMADLQTCPGKYPDWKGKVVLISASVDDNEETAAKHLKAKGWDQTHNVWVGTNAIKAFHVNAVPTTYIIDRQGMIVAANPADIPEIVNRMIGAKATAGGAGSATLQAGDKITVKLTGIPVPSDPVTIEISPQGTIKLPFLGHPLQAAGKTPRELQEIIQASYVPDVYMQVNVAVTQVKMFLNEDQERTLPH